FAINETYANEFSISIVGLNQGSALLFADSTNNTMVPEELEMGQELEGTGGAASGGDATYSGISYTLRYVINVGEFAVEQMPAESSSDSPPFTSWVILPEPNVYPSFRTSCC